MKTWMQAAERGWTENDKTGAREHKEVEVVAVGRERDNNGGQAQSLKHEGEPQNNALLHE